MVSHEWGFNLICLSCGGVPITLGFWERIFCNSFIALEINGIQNWKRKKIFSHFFIALEINRVQSRQNSWFLMPLETNGVQELEKRDDFLTFFHSFRDQ
jgi:hypothetical protein